MDTNYSQKARVDAGTHVSPAQQGGSCDAPHSCPFAEHLPPLVLPRPVSDTSWGLPDALSEIESVPARLPASAGVIVTEIVQFAPCARVAAQVLVWAKLGSATTFVMSRAALPELVTVTDRGALVPATNSVPKPKLEADRETWGAPLGRIAPPPQPLIRPKPQSTRGRYPFILSLLTRE